MELLVYAIVSAKNNPEKLFSLLPGIKGISGTSLFSVPFDEVIAVVCEINRIDLNANQSDAIEYARVIESLAEDFALLPMRFGSVMESTQAVHSMLERNLNEILKNLEKVDHKCEFGIKIFCDYEKIRSDLKVKTENIVKPNSEPGQGTKSSIYFDYVNQKLKEHRLEELLMTFVDSVIAEIKERLARLNSENKIRKIGAEKNIIDVVFLFKKDNKDELIKMVESIQNQYAGIKFVLTGPWPPYSFIDITIK